jgi:uncharacterized protein
MIARSEQVTPTTGIRAKALSLARARTIVAQIGGLVRLSIFLICLAPGVGKAVEFEWVPKLEGRVNDIANVLSDSQRERLTDMLASYEQETGHQIAILTIPALNGESIESFSLRVANSWKIGLRNHNNGILIVLALADKRSRITLGFGMERYITNELAKSIIATSMSPSFKQGQFAEGLEKGLLPLMEAGRKFVIDSTARRRYLDQ